jgi:murein DD-endopeptidase MepM/ murein hydrolase activator NlpD
MNKESIQDSFLNLSVFKMSSFEAEDGELTLKLYIENSNDIYLVQNIDSNILIEALDVKYRIEKKTIEGKIVGNLFDSVLNSTGSERLASIIAESFNEEFKTAKGLKVDASFNFEVDQYFEGDEFADFGNISKASIVVGKAIIEKTSIQDPNNNTFSLKNLIPDESEKIFTSPVNSNLISSLFNLARRHPVKRRLQPHNGIDFIAKSGTPVFPALEGEVIAVGRTKAKGKFILIRHDNGFETTYDHLRKFQKGIRVGMYVDIYDQIGEVGRTGYATGAHLHFGMLKDGMYVNPINYLK